MIGVIDVGGGTRGIFGAGVFDWCMDQGISFDYLIGVSAGSANMTTFLAGQRGRNYKFYDEYAFRKEYMSLRNLIFKREYVDLDYIYSTLSNSDGENPMDYKAFAANPTQMEIVVTNALTGKASYFSKSDIGYDDYDCIKASCAVPVVCTPYTVYGVPYYDGGLSDPIPYKRAFEKGCDKLIVILTRPKNMIRDPKKDNRLEWLTKRRYPKAAEAIHNRAQVYNTQLREVLQLERQGKALIIAPDDIGDLKTLTKDHEPLRRLYKKGYSGAAAIPQFLNA